MRQPRLVQTVRRCEFAHLLPLLFPGYFDLIDSRTSPTAYNAYSYFNYYTLDKNSDGLGDCITDLKHQTYPGDTPAITLSSTVYQVLPGGALDSTDLYTLGDLGYQSFPADFHNYILSDSALIASYPFLKTCYTLMAHGFPSVKVRVSALTASSYNTMVGSGTFTASSTDTSFTPGTSAVPGSTMKAPAAPSTTTASTRVDHSTTTASKQADHPTHVPIESPSSPGLGPSSIASNSPGAPADPSNRHSDGPLQSESGIPSSFNDVSYSSTLPVVQMVAGSSIITMNLHDTASNDATAPVITIGGQPLTADSAFNYHIGSQTLIPGGPTIAINNIHYSLAPSATALVSDGNAIALPPSTDGSPKAGPPVITIGNQEYTANSASQYIVGTQTLAVGGKAVTVKNIPYSLPSSAAAIISGSVTVPLDSNPSRTPSPITVDGNTYTANFASQYVIGTQTLTPGAPAITINGIPYSLAPSDTALVSGSVTIPLTPNLSHTSPAITIEGTTYTADSASEYIIGTQTLIPNGPPITLHSTPYALSLGPSAEALIVGTSTSFLSSPIPLGVSVVPTTTSSPNLTAQSHGYVIDGQALTPGSEITVSGTKISLGAQGTDVVVGGTTEAVGLGGVIMSAFGAGPTASVGNASGGVVEFTGGASGERAPGAWDVCGVLVVGVLVWLPPL